MLRSKVKLRWILSSVIPLLLCVTVGWFYFASPSAQSGSEISPTLVAELLDRRHAVTLLPRESYETRVLIPLSAINNTAIDRRLLLATLFSKVTAGQPTDQLRIEAWVHYLQDRVVHPKWAPMLNNGQAIYDPYWILKNRIAHCGQINRVVIDGLSTAGFKARVVQLKSHVAAEVWLDGAWRFLDADWLNFGQFVRFKDGSLASAEDIHNNPKLLDGLMPGLEFKLYPVNFVLKPYEEMFSVKPFYYIKTATAEQEKNEYFGWNYYKEIRE